MRFVQKWNIYTLSKKQSQHLKGWFFIQDELTHFNKVQIGFLDKFGSLLRGQHHSPDVILFCFFYLKVFQCLNHIIFTAVYVLLQSLIYSLWKKIIIQFIFLWWTFLHEYQFWIPMFFCMLFWTSVNKAELIFAAQTKLLFELNYLKSSTESLSFQILVVSNTSKIFGTLFLCCH